MSKRVAVIGAGINGLVAANYLRRAGCEVLHLEKKDKVGGACTMEWTDLGGTKYPIPTGASVFGMMQDFVFKDTGLSQRLQVGWPQHKSLVYFGDEPHPWPDDSPAEYDRELDSVVQFVRKQFREAATPTIQSAREALGDAVAARWITGDAVSLFNHFGLSERARIFASMPVNESGPVALDGPGTAFSIPLMHSGTVSGGSSWAFINGALWRLPLALADLNKELGVELLTGVNVEAAASNEVRFTHAGRSRREKVDAVFFGTDPVTAAVLTGDKTLEKAVRGKKFVGSSGKMVFVFKEPVVWKHSTGKPDFSSAFRYIYESDSWKKFEASNEAVRENRVDFSPCFFQVYAEGSNMRRMGWNEPYDYFSVFFKDFAVTKPGRELPEVKRMMEERILKRIENKEAFVDSVLFTPRDLKDTFFFPEGNIDHMEMCEGQTHFARTFSSEPSREFYRLGSLPETYYCGAGAYPCGSVAGTPGYLAATQWLRSRL